MKTLAMIYRDGFIDALKDTQVSGWRESYIDKQVEIYFLNNPDISALDNAPYVEPPEDMELAVPRKLAHGVDAAMDRAGYEAADNRKSTGEKIADRVGMPYLRDARDVDRAYTVRGSTKDEGEAREIPGEKSNFVHKEPGIFDSITADAVRRRRDLTGLGLAECRKELEIDLLLKRLEHRNSTPEALHQGYKVDALYQAVSWLLKRARNGSQ